MNIGAERIRYIDLKPTLEYTTCNKLVACSHAQSAFIQFSLLCRLVLQLGWKRF